MGSECALFTLPFFPNPDSFIFHLFVGFHFTLKQYGGWVRPLQLRCQYSTVQCVIQLHEIFQMWLRSLTNGGGSFPCNTDAIFIVFDNLINSVTILLFRDTYAYQEQPLVPRPRGFFTRKRHERLLLLLIFSNFFRDTYPPLQQLLLPRPPCFLTHEDRVLLLIFFADSHTILSTHRVHGTSSAWCFCGSIVQWYTGSGIHPPFPRPLKLLCCRCFLNFRRVQDLHVPCYWCEMLQGMGYPPRF